jgi:hypothetical protein
LLIIFLARLNRPQRSSILRAREVLLILRENGRAQRKSTGKFIGHKILYTLQTVRAPSEMSASICRKARQGAVLSAPEKMTLQ